MGGSNPSRFVSSARAASLSSRSPREVTILTPEPSDVTCTPPAPNGPSSEQLARLFETIFSRYPKASAIGFATIPSPDEGGLALAAVNRMILGAVKGVKAREQK